MNEDSGVALAGVRAYLNVATPLAMALVMAACPEPPPPEVTLPPVVDAAFQNDTISTGDSGTDSGPSEDAEVAVCQPTTCETLGYSCGQHDDGCGGTLDCDTLCVAYENASTTCGGAFVCQQECDSGYHLCDDGSGSPFCGDDVSPDTCGTSCVPCATPDNGISTCFLGECGIACSTGFEACTDGVDGTEEICVDLTSDANHCGECNKFCPAGCFESDCIPEYDLNVIVGDAQTGTINNILAVPIQVEVTNSGEPAALVDIEFVSAEGAALDPPVAQTNTSGIAFASVRLGREPGLHTFTARLVIAPNASVEFTATAEAPADGTIFSLVNWEHVDDNTGVPGPGPMARIGEPWGVTVASDGTIYFTDSDNSAHKVRALSPAGELIDIAGDDTSGGFAGDFGAAVEAKLKNPRGIALDENTDTIYFADMDNDRVRKVDLSNGIIDTVAGGGSAVGPGYGDGGLAAVSGGGANLSAPTHLSLGPGGLLYIADSKHDRIRVVDPVANTINAFVSATTSNKCQGDQVVLVDCAKGCAMAWSDAGAMFLSGEFACGETEAKVNEAVPGIVRVEADGSLHHVAGKLNGSSGNNIPAQSAALGDIEGLALDPAGNLIISEGDTVRVIDAAIGRLTTLAGQDTPGSLGDFGPALDAFLATPVEVAFWGKHLIIADSATFSIRTIWNVGADTSSSATLAIAGGDAQTAIVGQQFALPLSAEINDDSGGTLPGVPVTFTSLNEGGGVVAPRSPAAANGIASMAARPGLIAGTYAFEASFRDIHGNHAVGSPVAFATTATEPADGTILSIVNADGVPGDEATPAAGTLTRVGNVVGIAVADDGTVYFTQTGTDRHRVRALSPAGELYNIAGIGTQGFSGNNGPAVLAEFNQPYGLALDQAQQILYVADSQNNVVRAIELTGEKRITTYAGGGTADETTNFGDNGLAIMASLDIPTHLALTSDGSLYITDSQRDRIRRVDGLTGFITTPLQRPGNPGQTGCLDEPVFGKCNDTCALATDSADALYVLGDWACISTTATSASATDAAIVKIDGLGLTHLVGDPTGSPADVVPVGLNAKISQSRGLVVDDMGNIYFTDDEHRVRWWDATDDVVSTLAGQFNSTDGEGIPGFGGDYGPALSAFVNDPRELALTPDGHLVFADFENAAVRLIWNVDN